MALVSANQFQLVPDVGRALQTGSAIGQQFAAGQQRRQATQRAAQTGQFATQALAGDQEALSGVASADPARAIQIQTFLANQSDAQRQEVVRENESLTRTALIAKTLPPQNRRAFIERQRDVAKTEGRDTARMDRALSGNDDQLFEAIEMQAVEGQNISDIVKQISPTPTTLQRNVQAAGFTPGTPEFQAEVLRGVTKPATQITIGGEKKEQEKLAELRVKQLGTFQEEREAAIDANQSLDVLDNIDVNTGALEPAKQGLAAFGRAFGIDTSRLANVSAGEAFNAEAQRIVLAVKASQKGPQTDKDEATIRQTVASLGNTKEGNQFIIDSARALNIRKIDRADFFDKLLEDTGSLKGANRDWAKFKRNTPMVSSNLRTPEALPVFFFKFEQDVRAANPDATRGEILEAWREADKRQP